MRDVTIKIEGNPYRLTSLDARQYQEFLDFSKTALPDPVDAVLATAGKLPEGKVRDDFLTRHLDAAFERSKLRGTLSDPDLDDFIRSSEGSRKLFSLMFKKHHPHLTADECLGLVVAAVEEHGPDVFKSLHQDGSKTPMKEDAVEARYFRNAGDVGSDR